eukprot:gene2802-3224_t
MTCTSGTEQSSQRFGVLVYDSLQDQNRLITLSSLESKENQLHNFPFEADGIILLADHKGYYVMEKNTKLVHYSLSSGGLKKEQELSMGKIPYEPYSSWLVQVKPGRILLGNMDKDSFACTEIDLDKMNILRYRKLQVPPAKNGKNYAAISAQFAQDRLFIFYTFQKGFMREHLNPADGWVYGVAFDYPELKQVRAFSDSRTTWPGSYNIWGPNTLCYRDTIYVLGQPGGRTANHPEAPSGILRIDAGENTFDKGYFFKLGEPELQEAYSLHDVGNGLAITKMVNSKDIRKFDDYLQKESGHYELLDLKHQRRLRLAVGAIVPDFWKNVWSDHTKAYLPVYLGGNKSRIEVYDLQKGVLSPGPELPGRIIRDKSRYNRLLRKAGNNMT